MSVTGLSAGSWTKVISGTSTLGKRDYLHKKDMRAHAQFAWKVIKFLPEGFWREEISFYFDGVRFTDKTNPLGEACAAGAMTWRKPSEGIASTTKGKKEGNCGKQAHFLVTVAYDKGLVCCKQYTETLTDNSFAEFVRGYFPLVFQREQNQKAQLFLQDGDPRQNSKVAHKAMESNGCRLFEIPPRSPDINPIENMFHLIRRQLTEDALQYNIIKETLNSSLIE